MATRAKLPVASPAQEDTSTPKSPRLRFEDVRTGLDALESVGKILLALGVLIALLSPGFATWISKDEQLSGAIKVVSTSQPMTLQEYRDTGMAENSTNYILDRSDYSDADLAAHGHVVYFTAEFHGLRGRHCGIRFSVRDAKSGNPDIAPTQLLSVTPETNNDTYVWDVWVPDPTNRKSNILTLELLDHRGARLAVSTTVLTAQQMQNTMPLIATICNRGRRLIHVTGTDRAASVDIRPGTCKNRLLKSDQQSVQLYFETIDLAPRFATVKVSTASGSINVFVVDRASFCPSKSRNRICTVLNPR